MHTGNIVIKTIANFQNYNLCIPSNSGIGIKLTDSNPTNFGNMGGFIAKITTPYVFGNGQLKTGDTAIVLQGAS